MLFSQSSFAQVLAGFSPLSQALSGASDGQKLESEGTCHSRATLRGQIQPTPTVGSVLGYYGWLCPTCACLHCRGGSGKRAQCHANVAFHPRGYETRRRASLGRYLWLPEATCSAPPNTYLVRMASCPVYLCFGAALEVCSRPEPQSRNSVPPSCAAGLRCRARLAETCLAEAVTMQVLQCRAQLVLWLRLGGAGEACWAVGRVWCLRSKRQGGRGMTSGTACGGVQQARTAVPCPLHIQTSTPSAVGAACSVLTAQARPSVRGLLTPALLQCSSFTPSSGNTLTACRPTFT